MTELNFEEDLAIDLDNLHEEWRSHARTRYEYAKEVAHLDKVVKKAHEQVKVTRSRLISEAKEKKLSSADLREGYYREHKDHIAAKNKQIDAEYDLSMAWNALNAFDNRKGALENEVRLWQGEWFAGPKEPKAVKPGKRIVDIGRGETEAKQREGLKKRVRKDA